MFATAVLVVATALVGYAAIGTLGRSDDDDDGGDDGPR